MGLLDFITPVDGGPIRVREKGFAVAAVPSLGRCAVENRGARVRVEGASGIADGVYECLKDGADAYDWELVVLPGGVYTDENARDAIGAALVAGNNIDITVNDGADTITIAVETLSVADITDLTASAAELNVLDGITASTTELNYTDGVTSAIQTQLDGKQPLDSDLTTIAGLVDPNADRMLFWDDSAGAYAYLAASTGLTISGTNMTVRTASATQTGIVELATDAETTTGTDTTRAITPANFTSQIGTRVPALAHTHAASDITSGTMATARLGSGTANSSSYLRGDQTWDTISIDELNDVSIATPAQGQLLTYDAGSWVNADPQQGIMTLDDRTHAYAAQFLTTGSGNTNCDTPGQIAIDGSGNIFIADTANNRLKKHDSSGTYVSAITSLTAITGVAVDSSNNVYTVHDTGNIILRKYNSSLVQQWTQTLVNTDPATHLCTDGTTVFLLAIHPSSGEHTVFRRLCSDGSAASPASFGSTGTGDGEFTNPTGIATDGTYLYVVDQGNDRVQKFTKDGAYISKWGRSGSDPGEFQTAVGIHYNSVTGTLYVTDSGRDDVQEFTTGGGFVGSFGAAGTGNGQLQDASGIANDVAGDSVWVADATQDRLQKFTRSVTSEEATRVFFNSNDFIVSSTDGGETGFISLAEHPEQSTIFQDDVLRVVDNNDGSKQVAFEASGITTGTTRTLTVPDASGTIALVEQSGLVLVSGPTAFSAQSSVSVNNCFTSDYRNYRIVLNLDSASAAATLSMRMRASGSDTSSSNYDRMMVNVNNGAATVSGVNTSGATSWPLITTLNGALDAQIILDIADPQTTRKVRAAGEMTHMTTATTAFAWVGGALFMRVTTQFDGFSLIMSSGNMTGEIAVYGYGEG